MYKLIGLLLLFVIILAFLFGGLCSITGEEKKGNTIVVNCITAMVLYLLVIELFNYSLPAGGIFKSGIPLVNNVEKIGSVKNYLLNNPGAFAIDFVELVALTLMINLVSNLFSFEEAGFAGKVISRIVIVLGGIIAYGFLMDIVRDNIILKWCVYCVECVIMGSSILYTPIMVISFITGLKKDNIALVYLVEQFPNTSIGKAIFTAVTSSVMFLGLMIALESQYGSMCNILQGTVDGMESFGSVIVMTIGLYIIISGLKKRNK